MNKPDNQDIIIDDYKLQPDNDLVLDVYKKLTKTIYDIAVPKPSIRKPRKGRMPRTVSFRSDDRWVLFAEKILQVAPRNSYKYLSELIRASCNIGLFWLAIMFHKDAEDEDPVGIYQLPDSEIIHKLKEVRRLIIKEARLESMLIEKEIKDEYEGLKEWANSQLEGEEKDRVLAELEKMEAEKMRLFMPKVEEISDDMIDNIIWE